MKHKFSIGQPLAVSLKLLSVIASTEFFIMTAFQILRLGTRLSSAAITLIDTLALSVVSSAAIYNLIIKPSRVRMEERILQSERDWENTFNQLTEMITIQDVDFNIIRANRAAEKILGLPGPGGPRVKCHEYYHGKDSPLEVCPCLETIKTIRPSTVELYEPHLNMFLEVTTIPRFDSGKRMMGIIHVAKDITRRKRPEEI